VLSGSYVAPLLGTPLTLVGYAVHSNSSIAAIGDIGVIGNGDIVGLRGIYAASRGMGVHQVIAGIDYKSFNEDLVLGSDTASTPIDYMPVLLQYSYAHRDGGREFDLSFGLNAGIRGLAADDREFRLKRFNASASWAYLRADMSMREPLPFWEGSTMAVRLGGQFSRRALISNEQFAIGGVDSIRGYYESQELGDYGVFGQVEFETPRLFASPGADVRFMAFADVGWLGIHDAIPDLNGVIHDRAKLASIGAGMRVRVFDQFNGDFLLSAPLRDREETKTDIGDRIRLNFRLWTEY
jgi:hemolysin activation/secretion protein